ncbi:MAG TPA: HEAT repeat domain-containing protein [Urbifossiella sp.]|nr:HEAT repeat domain-containing protein [Urbifossiella sp.]
MGADAKAAAPAILAYHTYLASQEGRPPYQTLAALVKIAPESEGVQKTVLRHVAGLDESLPFIPSRPFGDPKQRERVLDLMNEMPIKSGDKMTALAAGAVATQVKADAAVMAGQIGELDVANKEKCTALMRVVLSKSPARATAIEELGKLGQDAKLAVPLLTRLKTDPDGAVREAVTAALGEINK